MKTKILLVISVVVIVVTLIAWANRNQSALARHDLFSRTLSMSKNKVSAVEEIDSILSQNPEYRKLKREQYNLFIVQRNFALPPPESIRKQVIAESGLDAGREHDADMAVWMFRLAVMYQIIDDFPHPNNPTKEKITNDVLEKFLIAEEYFNNKS